MTKQSSPFFVNKRDCRLAMTDSEGLILIDCICFPASETTETCKRPDQPPPERGLI